MEITPINVQVEGERRLIANLIMSTDLLLYCTEMGKPELFTEGVCRTVATWLWEYFQAQHAAPGRAIEDIYLHKAQYLREADSSEIRLFLSNLNDDWAPTNLALIKEQALDFFRLAGIKKLRDDIDRALLVRDAARGESIVAQYVAPAPIHSTTVSLFSPQSAPIVRDAFNEESEVLLTYEGDAGLVLGTMAREDFVAFGAPPKRGKTWWLIRTARDCAKAGLRVLFLSLEMKQAQVLRRFWQCFTGCSRKGEEARYSAFMESSPGRFTIVPGQLKTNAPNLDEGQMEAAMRNMAMYYRGDLRIRTYPSNSLTIARLKEDLDSMALYEHFVPDVIVADYADIFKHTTAAKEMRDRINDTWVSLRGLASERHALVVTATQTGRATVGGQKDAEESDVAEDIRKVAHVTKMIMINQNATEREQGLYRLACNTTRDEPVAPSQLLCTACLAIGEPMLDAHMIANIDYQSEEDEEEPRRKAPSKRGFKL